ncbi:hypothetical protein BDB00DRAFT_797231 [Zychaea mexicana]|uniref:uncharacterized protein n=1 Tax=Zychaea mexicana TaxID=64656 RepID=UPI0022FDCEFC|nr:uncharacterized protein BDB00DRAFT_851372 [Zychaea mexicana]XP_052981238.1 uncharacterized protein BDB00DRAFT_816495 [Zychaea mexicana]XP_052985170.1 uncharacterized protein BDB00DRAFT_797231 [Zychaea mexicana]KAI9485159.1 hypothetical protein BDB00DRAFT_851372 [Zychaea mexicana]KAI9494973.1 hypothetical protein BDB00DRAFT_816495 [Zychaea mexicana]KAI9498905.1 hypothetical protein BDB00DRAFT_797231 [Zychaea mexicana]
MFILPNVSKFTSVVMIAPYSFASSLSFCYKCQGCAAVARCTLWLSFVIFCFCITVLLLYHSSATSVV